MNDLHTATLTRDLAAATGAATLVNAALDRNDVDLNRLTAAHDRLPESQEPFVQINARLTRDQEGVGLGLAISRDLAREMGGELTAESSPGIGSTFTLVMPTSAPAATTEAPAP